MPCPGTYESCLIDIYNVSYQYCWQILICLNVQEEFAMFRGVSGGNHQGRSIHSFYASSKSCWLDQFRESPSNNKEADWKLHTHSVREPWIRQIEHLILWFFISYRILQANFLKIKPVILLQYVKVSSSAGGVLIWKRTSQLKTYYLYLMSH